MSRSLNQMKRDLDKLKKQVKKMPPKVKHDGNLQHNASVFYEDKLYIRGDGSHFYNEEISISDKMSHVSLIPKEALSLLEWLQQEKPNLERLMKEQGEE